MRLVYLSDKFYDDHARCREIMTKRNRPYACLEVMIDGVPFAIPFRHHIKHSYAFLTGEECGLDYSKAVVVRSDEDIVQGVEPQIEQAEYNAIKGKELIIVSGMRRYVKLYRKAKEHAGNPFYQNILRLSTLQYFEWYLRGRR